MSTPAISLGLLTAGCFSLATWVGPSFDQMHTRRGDSVLGGILGESRQLFANHFFTRSDVYFHSGYYPSIFEQAGMKKENHVAVRAEKCEHDHEGPCDHDHGDDHKAGHADAHDDAKETKGHAEAKEAAHEHDEHCDHDKKCSHGDKCDGDHSFLGKAKDPMDAFSRHFFVSQHTHLTDKGTNAPKEILPWIKLAAQLDPHKVESYTVGAYWLRSLHKNGEAEQFLREGLRHNPSSYEILLELGQTYFEQKDYVRARNVLERGMERWRERENPKPQEQQDRFAALQILNYLARTEDRTGNAERTVRWLEIVRKISPHPEEVDKRIAEVRAGQRLVIE